MYDIQCSTKVVRKSDEAIPKSKLFTFLLSGQSKEFINPNN